MNNDNFFGMKQNVKRLVTQVVLSWTASAFHPCRKIDIRKREEDGGVAVAVEIIFEFFWSVSLHGAEME